MKKLLSILLIVGFLAGGVFLGYATQPSAYKINLGDARWHTKLNAGLDALWDFDTSIAVIVSNWVGIQSYQTATYVGASSFSVVGDLTSKYSVGQLLLLNQGVAGLVANTVVTSSYAAPITTVIVTTANVVATLGQAQILNPTSSEVVVASDYGTNQAALEAADVVAAAAGKQLVIGRTYSITGNCTLASNIKVLPVSGGAFPVAATKTLTINGTLDAGLYQIFSCTDPGKVAGLKSANAEWWGAVGNNSTDDYVALQQAITQMATSEGTLHLQGKTYYSSDNLIIPTQGVNHLGKFALRGAKSTTCDTTNSPDGTVIRFAAAKNGLSTPVVDYTGTQAAAVARTAKHIEITDIYVQGPLTLATAAVTDTTKGFYFPGVMFLRTNNIHAEGFGYGLFVEQSGESYFGGTTFMQNNYYGAYVKRYDPATYNGDSIAWFDNLVTVINYIPVWFDGPRSVFVKSGQNMTYGLIAPLTGRAVQPRIKITNCYNDSQIHFSNYMMENDEDTPSAQIDASGIGILTFDKSNLSGSLNRIVSCAGFFNQISVTNSVMDRTYLASIPRPLVELTNAAVLDTAGWNRTGQVTLEGNSPPWADFAVKDSTVGKSPYRDYVPRGFQQVNPRRELDEAFDNRLSPQTVSIGFTTTNALCGKARAYFTVNADLFTARAILITPARPLKGAEIIYVTCIVDDNVGAKPPIFVLAGVGAGPVDWGIPYQVLLETYTVGTRTFRKYGVCFVVMNKTLLSTVGVTGIYIYDIYSNEGADASKSGIEIASVYVDTRQVGYVEPVVKKQEAAPVAAIEGYYVVGDTVDKLTPATGSPPKWYCTVTGNPGTWKATANLP